MKSVLIVAVIVLLALGLSDVYCSESDQGMFVTNIMHLFSFLKNR